MMQMNLLEPADPLTLESPTHGLLDQLAVFYHRLNNEKDAEDWVCPNPKCRMVNAAVKNVFVHVYPIYCSKCSKLIKASQDFKLTDCILNDIDIDFPAYRQDSGCCTAASLLGGVDLARRMKSAVLYKASDSLPLDPKSLTASFLTRFGVALGQEPGDAFRYRILNVMKCAEIDGIAFLPGYGVFDKETSDFEPIKICGQFVVDTKDIFLAKRLIASGYPLIGQIISGKGLSNLGASEVYIPPKFGYPYPHPVMSHAILLQGSGTNDGGIYFGFRDSEGRNCHRRWFDYDGADGRLRPGDFDGYLFGFVLEGWLPKY